MRTHFLSSATAVLLAGSVIALSGCGDGDSARAVERIPISTIDYGTRKADYGNPRELNQLANIYATIQRRFQARDMAGVCAHVSRHMLSQFPPNRDDPDTTPCTRRLTVYARELRKKDPVPRPKLRIDWLRIYDYLDAGGITATDNHGQSMRIPFIRENGRWNLQLGVFSRPDTLNGTILRPQPTP